jgi:hypothetical protein
VWRHLCVGIVLLPQFLATWVDAPTVLVAEDAVPHRICLEPTGSGDDGDRWSASLRSTTGILHTVTVTLMGALLAGLLASDFSDRRATTPPCLLALNAQLKVFFYLLLWRPYSSAMIGSRCGDSSGRSSPRCRRGCSWLDAMQAGPDCIFLDPRSLVQK